MRIKHVLVVTVGAAMVMSATPTMALAEEPGAVDAVADVAAAATVSGPQVVVRDVTINASQLKGNARQLIYQLKDLMLVSAKKGDRDITNMVDPSLGNNSADLLAKKPGVYDIPFYYGGSDIVATAKLTVTDSASVAPKLTVDEVAAADGGVLLSVMGQGITNEPHTLPAGSFSVGEATQQDGTWYTTVTINSSAIDAYYRPLVPAVVLNRVAYNAGESSLMATFKYDPATQKWVVDSPAKVSFDVVLSHDGNFEFEDSATVAPSDVKGISSNDLLALIKQKLVKKAEVNGQSVVNAYGFKVMLGTQLRDIQDGKPGTYEIGFMYDGDGFNNEVVGTAKLVIAEPKQPVVPGGSTNPEQPVAPGGSTNPGQPTSPEQTGTSNAGKPAATAGEKKVLPQTGDESAAMTGMFAAAGVVAYAFSLLAKRRDDGR